MAEKTNSQTLDPKNPDWIATMNNEAAVRDTLVSELRFAAGIMVFVFAIAHALNWLGYTSSEPRDTYVSFALVLSAILYAGTFFKSGKNTK